MLGFISDQLECESWQAYYPATDGENELAATWLNGAHLQ
jgi:hypothetical protein